MFWICCVEQERLVPSRRQSLLCIGIQEPLLRVGLPSELSMASREWMYSGWQRGKAPSNEWIDNTTEFLNRAFSMQGVVQGDTIKCPCAQCRNYFRHKRETIELHLCKNGFKENYKTWTAHGERLVVNPDEPGPSIISHEGFGESDRMDDMLLDLAGAKKYLRNFRKIQKISSLYLHKGTYSSHAGGGSDGNNGRDVDGNSGRGVDGNSGDGGGGGGTTSSNASE
ncbi:hypothetical protein ACP70R_001153 [Stipagrostis hirtigluma subsp. patula]